MGGKSSPPPPPDYTSAAKATASGNLDATRAATDANRVNQVTPYGNLTYTQDPNSGSPDKGWQSTITLSDTGQKLLDASNQSSLGLSGLQSSALDNVKNTMGQPMSTKGVMPLTGQVVGASPVQTKLGDTGNIQTGLSGLNNGQGSINTAGIPGVTNQGISTPDEAYRKQYQDAVYGQQAQYLDPQFEQSKKAFDSQMANQGLVPGDEAYNAAAQNYNSAKQQAYSNAQMNAITGGLGAQQANFGMGLQGNQQLNANQAQQFGQSAAQTAAANQQAGIQNQNAIASGQFANAAQAQQFQNALAAAEFNNQGQSQMFSQGLANANLGNQANQLGMQNAYNAYNQPLNTLNAIRTGSQVQNPQFTNVPQQQATTGPDILGATTQGYNAALGGVNAQNAASGNFNNGLMGLLGTAGMYAMMSDRRNKENITKISTRPDGLNVYTFTYKQPYQHQWGYGLQTGVMSDEVKKLYPWAVTRHPDGYDVVHYGKLH